ncbi:serine protein kinase, partial [Clostridium perfringens]|nr:serine protein kinase [Clostridium perfringens]
MNFEEFIKSDRESRNKEKFEGTFLDYLEIVKEKPEVAKLSHKRIYDMVVSKGIEVLKGEENPKVKKIYGNDPIRRYGFFKDDFFGIDKVIMKLVNYLHSASMKGEEARQVLYLVGPV